MARSWKPHSAALATLLVLARTTRSRSRQALFRRHQGGPQHLWCYDQAQSQGLKPVDLLWYWRVCSPHSVGLGDWQIAIKSILERRVSGLVEARKTFGPAYRRFYDSLDDCQKRLIDGLGPGKRGWRS